MPGLHGLIVDFGGVLTSPVSAAIDAFCAEEALDRDAFAALIEQAYRSEPGPIARAERGELTTAELDAAMAATLRTTRADGLTGRLLGRLEWNEDMAELLREVRARHPYRPALEHVGAAARPS